MTTRRAGKPLAGRKALFRGKVRKPVSITLTKAHHEKLIRAKQRLKLTRGDVIGLLVERYADKVTLPRGSKP